VDWFLAGLSHLPDLQLVQAVWQLDIGLAAKPVVLADSAIAEVAKRANNLRITRRNTSGARRAKASAASDAAD
jgi:hypothetical protein